MSVNVEIANIIRDQIGRKALYMMGAKNLAAVERGLQFRIRGCSKINCIQIVLNEYDTYNVTYYKLGKIDYKEVAEEFNIYADMLHADIEEKTGLILKLF